MDTRLRDLAVRLGLTAAEAAALALLAGGAVAVCAVLWWTGRPAVTEPLAPPVVTASPTTPTSLLVHVAGAVHQPGVQRLPDGARVADAIAAAGGVTSEAALSALNLARPLSDGEQILVPETATALPAAASGAATGPLDLNLATAEALEGLPGVGPVLAARIVAHRDRIGRFRDVSELQDVPGIGPARFAELEPLVVVR